MHSVWTSGQDQVATIKRQLQLLLPGIKVFLVSAARSISLANFAAILTFWLTDVHHILLNCQDVDDLREIGKLEEYVEQSQCILFFLSKGYFFSKNCLRELDHTLKLNKPLILVHEIDPSHGGAEMDVLLQDATAKGRVELFDRQSTIITWQRISDFQTVTLKSICEKLLEEELKEEEQEVEELFIPGELSRQRLIFEKAAVVYTSAHNPGAAAMANELRSKFKSDQLKFLLQKPHR